MAKENQIAVEVVTKSDSIAGMREEIKGFRKALEEASIAGGDVTEATQQLNAAQNELRNVMKLGTKSVEDADDSYNTLTRTMAQLKEQWRATTDEVKRDELGKQIAGINQRLKDMDASVGDYFRNVGDYRNQIVGAFKDSTDALDHFLPGIGQVGTAIYDVVSAAESLSSILPVAIKGVKGLIGSLKGVKAAIAATGMGVFLILIGEVIANWERISELWKDTSPQAQAKAAIDRLNMSLEQMNVKLSIANTQALREYTEALKRARGDINAITAAQEAYNRATAQNEYDAAKAEVDAARAAQLQIQAEYDTASKRRKKKMQEDLKAAADAVLEAENRFALAENAIAKANADKLADAQKVTTPNGTPTADPEELRLQKMESIGLKEIEIRERVQNKLLEGMAYVQEVREKDLDHQRRMAAVEVELEDKKAQSKQAAAQIAIQAMQSATQLIGEETAVGKGLMVASALMQTYQAANSAYAAMAGIKIVGPALGIAAAAAAVASGLANVKQILSVKTDGSQNSIGGGAMTPAFVSAPAVIQQVPVTRSLTSASEEERLNKMASDTRVYVVESDIRQAGKRTEVREQESSF